MLWLIGEEAVKDRSRIGRSGNEKRSGHAFDPEEKGSHFDSRSHETLLDCLDHSPAFFCAYTHMLASSSVFPYVFPCI